jgi:hypothetical protein
MTIEPIEAIKKPIDQFPELTSFGFWLPSTGKGPIMAATDTRIRGISDKDT